MGEEKFEMRLFNLKIYSPVEVEFDGGYGHLHVRLVFEAVEAVRGGLAHVVGHQVLRDAKNQNIRYSGMFYYIDMLNFDAKLIIYIP